MSDAAGCGFLPPSRDRVTNWRETLVEVPE